MKSDFEQMDINPSVTEAKTEFKLVKVTSPTLSAFGNDVLGGLPYFKISKRHSRRKRKEIRAKLIKQEHLRRQDVMSKVILDDITKHIKREMDSKILQELYK